MTAWARMIYIMREWRTGQPVRVDVEPWHLVYGAP